MGAQPACIDPRDHRHIIKTLSSIHLKEPLGQGPALAQSLPFPSSRAPRSPPSGHRGSASAWVFETEASIVIDVTGTSISITEMTGSPGELCRPGALPTGPSGAVPLTEALGALVEELQRERSYPEWLLIRNGGKAFFVRVRDIDWIESLRNNVRLHVGRNTFAFHETTTGIESRLDPRRFLRIQRSAIVNIEHVKEIHSCLSGDCSVSLRDGTQLTMTSSYRKRLKTFRRNTVGF